LPGKTMQLEVNRNNKLITIDIVVAELK
jgi:hypothetical protein